MESEEGGLAATPVPERGKKRPPSPPTLSDDEDFSKVTDDDDNGEWLVSGSEEDEDKGVFEHISVPLSMMPLVDTPTLYCWPGCDHDKQSDVLFINPDTKLRGPLPIRLFPAFKGGEHYFRRGYNLADKSQISVDSVGDCLNECRCLPMYLVQFVDIKIAGYQHNHSGKAKIYGFIAARETTNRLRNYVYLRKIENCESVSVKRKTGVARLSMTGPARVISMISRALIEFEVHARNEDETNGDGDLIIEGCTELDDMCKSQSFIQHRRLYGERCALDIKYIVVMNAVEARVEVRVIRLGAIPGGINMKLYAKTSGFSEVIRLFQGAAPEPGVMMSFPVAVERHSGFDLYIEGSPRDDPIPGQKLRPYSWWQCGVASGYHGMIEKVAELGEFAAFSVKVTWRSYLKRISRG